MTIDYLYSISCIFNFARGKFEKKNFYRGGRGADEEERKDGD